MEPQRGGELDEEAGEDGAQVDDAHASVVDVLRGAEEDHIRCIIQEAEGEEGRDRAENGEGWRRRRL